MSVQNPIRIRPGRPADRDLLSDLGRRTFADTFGGDNHPADMAAYLDQAFNPRVQAAELADPRSLVLIAESDGHAVGYARLAVAAAASPIQARRPVRLVRLYVDKAWIGRGAGAALMTAGIAAARQRRCDGMWLGVWDRNRRAIAFYRRWGFVQVGTRDFVLGRDRQTDLVLWRPLADRKPGTRGNQPTER